MRTRAFIGSATSPGVKPLVGGGSFTTAPRKFSADRPWRGPVLGEYDTSGATVLIAVACDPGIGLAFSLACVPLLDTADGSPRLPGNGGAGVGLDEAEGEVKQALRDYVIWVPQRIDSTRPLVPVRIPIDQRLQGCSRMLPLLLSHLAPLDRPFRSTGRTLFPTGGALFGRADLAELQQAVLDPKFGLEVPRGDVENRSDFESQLIDCIFDLIDPRRGAWMRFESVLLHRPSAIVSASQASCDAGSPREISFFLASCLYPAGLFDGTPRYGEWSSGPADASLCRLAQMIDLQQTQRGPTILILSGDQIYADATAGLFDARLISDRLHFGYERLYRSRGATEAFARILPVMLIDDHEIRDNWEPEAPVPPARMPPIDPNVIYQEPDNWEQRNDGVREYWKQERAYWQPLGAGSPLKAPIDVEFFQDGAHFRFLDTRTRRSRRTAATIEKAWIVTKAQMKQLIEWLAKGKQCGTPRFIDTPSVFLPRHRAAIAARRDANNLPSSWASALRSDAWDGYPFSHHELLARLASEGHENVVFLSGDEHASFVTWARITALSSGASVVIRSIHSSGLYTPFPFANADCNDLAGDETFGFEVNRKPFCCEVKTRFFTCGAGFSKVDVTRSSDGSWDYQAEFFGDEGDQVYRSSGNGPWT